MAEEAAKMLTEGQIGVLEQHKLLAAATNNAIVGVAFGIVTGVFLAFTLRNFMDLWQAKRP